MSAWLVSVWTEFGFIISVRVVVVVVCWLYVIDILISEQN